MKRSLLSVIAILTLAAACQTTHSEDHADLHSEDSTHNHSDHDFMESNEQQPNSFTSAATASATTDAPLLPKNASAGECFARVLVPAKYQAEQVRLLKSESREIASVIPAKYSWAKKQILVKPESKKIVYVPAQYATVSERVLERPAYTTWKKGRGGLDSVSKSGSGATGEVLCKVEVPARYRTVSKRVLKSKASTKEVVIPAQYKTVTVQELSQDAKVVTKNIPAEYRTITRRKLVKQPYVEWKQVLCQTNATPRTVAKIQSSLKKKGFLNGSVDGVLGNNTLKAVKSFQDSKNLATGGLTLETAKALGVSF